MKTAERKLSKSVSKLLTWFRSGEAALADWLNSSFQRLSPVQQYFLLISVGLTVIAYCLSLILRMF